MPPTPISSTMDAPPLLVDEVVPRLPVRRLERVAGQRAERADEREERDDAEDAHARAEHAAEDLAPAHLDAAAGDDGVRELVEVLGRRREHVALLHERTPRHEVLAPRGHARADEEHPGAERRSERPGRPVLPVRRAEQREGHEAEEEEPRDDPLHVPGVPGGGLEVRVGHDRSPTQKPTSARRPTPSARPTNPSPTGPSPPSPAPPGFCGVLDALDDVGHDVAQLRRRSGCP